MLSRAAAELVQSAEIQGLQAHAELAEGLFPRSVIGLTRQCDLLIESSLHRQPFMIRLLENTDLYTDSCCPILITQGDTSAVVPRLLVYNATRQANAALRWVMALAANRADGPVPRVLVIWRDENERGKLVQEAHAVADAYGATAPMEAVAANTAIARTVELARELQPGIVALPLRPFPRSLRRWASAIDAQLLSALGTSVLLFP